MISKIWNKKDTQRTIKDLRAAGYVINKVRSGYESEEKTFLKR